jgi:hypothetical protein
MSQCRLRGRQVFICDITAGGKQGVIAHKSSVLL